MISALVICADDYAISPGTSAVIRTLLADGFINATTCLVETAIWPAEAVALKKLAEEKPGIAIGLHLNLTEAFSDAGPPRHPLGWWLRRALFPAAKADIAYALESCRRQWQLFVNAFGRPPDFVDGHQHVHLYGPARVALFALLRETAFTGWVRQCETSGRRFLAQRLLMDPMSRILRAEARAAGLRVNPGFGGLRAFDRSEDLARLWGTDLAAFSQGGLLIIHPGTGGSPPGTDAIDLSRYDEAGRLGEGLVQRLAAGLGLGLAADPRYPPWPPGK
jgi:predicted glycoside hydrolase/deacetylase ChbG (UPF0249 family)